MTKKNLRALGAIAAAAAALSAAPAAHALGNLYPGVGSENQANYTFTAAADGDLVAYFYGSTAGYDNTLSVLINGVQSPITGLDDHTSSVGQALDFGHVNAGDSLVFLLNANISNGVPEHQYFSTKSMNFDNVQHVYSTGYAGLPGVLPAGTYVSFEDLPYGGDLNYFDETFVFTNVATSVPEPTSALLLLAGLGALAARRRRA